MTKISTENIRNVALVGHNGTGKTTLTEALLCAAGAIRKKGSVADKNTVSDYDPDEKERGHSIETGILHFDYHGKRINLLDCPGLPDFAAGAEEGMAACETALIAVSATNGVEVMTRKLWNMATQLEKPKIFVITKMDNERADFDKVVEQLREVFGSAVAPLFLPIGEGKDFKGVIDLIDEIHDCPPELEEQAKAMHAQLVESCVACDEADYGALPQRRKTLARRHLPLLHQGPAQRHRRAGDVRLRRKRHRAERADDHHRRRRPHAFGRTAAPAPQESGTAQRLRRTHDRAQSGRPVLRPGLQEQARSVHRQAQLSARLLRRPRTGAVAAKCSSSPKPEKLAHFLEVQGKETKEKPVVVCGEIIALAKYENMHFGDTLTSDESGWELNPIPMPRP